MSVLRTSEFWVGLVAALCSFLVQQNVIPQGAADLVNMAFIYVLGRLVSKGAKAVFPN